MRNVAARALSKMSCRPPRRRWSGSWGSTAVGVGADRAICIEMGTRTAPLLIRTLRDGTPKARFWAARILGEIQENRACRSWRFAARSRSGLPVGRIVGAGLHRRPRHGGIVETALRDPVWYVRAHSAEALGKIGDTSMAASLGYALQDRSWWVRKNALDALVRLGEASKPALFQAMESGDRFARDCAIEALTTLGVPVAMPPRQTAPGA